MRRDEPGERAEGQGGQHDRQRRDEGHAAMRPLSRVDPRGRPQSWSGRPGLFNAGINASNAAARPAPKAAAIPTPVMRILVFFIDFRCPARRCRLGG